MLFGLLAFVFRNSVAFSMPIERNMPDSANHSDRDQQTREFMALLVPNQRRILAYILCMVPNKVDAEDILQETLTMMWGKFDQFEVGTDFVAWSVTIAKYKVLEFRRKTKGSKLQFGDKLTHILEVESDQKLKKTSKHIDLLRECVRKLALKEITFLKLRYEHDLTLKNIAARTGISLQGVHKAISLIHAKLVRCIRLTLRQETTA